MVLYNCGVDVKVECHLFLTTTAIILIPPQYCHTAKIVYGMLVETLFYELNSTECRSTCCFLCLILSVPMFFFFVELFHIHTTWIDVLQIVDCFCFNRRHVRKASVHLLVAFDSFIQRELNREKWKGRINQLKRRHRSPCWCSIAGELISSKKYYARFIQHEIHVLFHFRYVRFDVKWTFI